ncbi:hypothetical protein NEOLI_000387 [Neolecta irregularis DAH-3]|uniref:LDB19 N-terminal domain-containing protein n=1 Tax=Neolecta irregularis (strain DAH-3) TaxID=1198029 RepID=A0A1U7LUF9_NEOID|nr:hypothetical protein NEOLI_000387 [Neolecta irregularis DAH-3]|eukprot:OLL26310.1 hypothetical protein NEOLI_000387 [Neolecta irregularis DAH-3]
MPSIRQHGLPISVGFEIPSLPLVSYESPKISSGALLTGNIKLEINVSSLELDSFIVEVIQLVTSKRPVKTSCLDCITRKRTMCIKRYISVPVLMAQGSHEYPLTFLFKGSWPATTSSRISLIEYYLVATVTSGKRDGKTVSYISERPIHLNRSYEYLEEGLKHLRKFPDTSVKCKIFLPTSIHPHSSFLVTIQFTGLKEQSGDVWGIDSLNWMLKEYGVIVSLPCFQHAHHTSSHGFVHEEKKIVGAGRISKGFKYIDAQKSECHMEFEFFSGQEAASDVSGPSGIEISHDMTLDFTVLLARKGAGLSTRVLSMKCPVVISSRPGMGISWDNETPPMYGTIPRHKLTTVVMITSKISGRLSTTDFPSLLHLLSSLIFILVLKLWMDTEFTKIFLV